MAIKILGKNRQANFEYEILKTYEAGIVLHGAEVKSIKSGSFSLKEAYITDDKGELWIYGMHVAKWKFSNIDLDYSETRKRKLLLHKKEIERLALEKQRQGLTIVPLDVHLNRGKVKLNIALAKGRKLGDKKERLKEKDNKRSLDTDLKKMGY